MTKRQRVKYWFLPSYPRAGGSQGRVGWADMRGRLQNTECGGWRHLDRNTGFKWSSRVKLGSFTDTRAASIPEFTVKWRISKLMMPSSTSSLMTDAARGRNMWELCCFLWSTVHELVVNIFRRCVIIWLLIWMRSVRFHRLGSCRLRPPCPLWPSSGRGKLSKVWKAERDGERIREWSLPLPPAHCDGEVTSETVYSGH